MQFVFGVEKEEAGGEGGAEEHKGCCVEGTVGEGVGDAAGAAVGVVVGVVVGCGEFGEEGEVRCVLDVGEVGYELVAGEGEGFVGAEADLSLAAGW